MRNWWRWIRRRANPGHEESLMPRQARNSLIVGLAVAVLGLVAAIALNWSSEVNRYMCGGGAVLIGVASAIGYQHQRKLAKGREQAASDAAQEEKR
jgi:ABC-type Fe3+ transport system permease subunit